MSEPDAELVCGYCPPEDNRWPQSAFKMGGNAYVPKPSNRKVKRKRICNACWQERYGRMYTKCPTCGSRGNNWRRKDRIPEESPVLVECKRCRTITRRGTAPGTTGE